MIGLEYILGLYDMQQNDLADQLGIKKQNITLWIRKRQNISKKHLPTLESIFNIPQEYFQKELDEIDKLRIQKLKLDKELEDSEYEYEDYIYNENSGERVPVTRIGYDSGSIQYHQYESTMIDRLETLQKIDNIILEQDDSDDLHDITSKISDRTELFDRFADVVQCMGWNKQLLHEIMRAVELTTESLRGKNKVLGKGRPNSSSIEDERPIVQELFAVISKYLDKQQKEIQEIMDMFPQTQEDNDFY